MIRWPLIGAILLILVATACSEPTTPSLANTATPWPIFTPTPTHASPVTSPLVAILTDIPSPASTLAPAATLASTLNPTPAPHPSLPADDTTTSTAIGSSEPLSRPFSYLVVNPEPPRRVPNATRYFWITNGTTGERREITARLRVQTEHVAMWVEEGVWHDVRELQEAATFFETRIYPTTHTAFGSEWTPGVDNDPHIHILHIGGPGEGTLGYTSSADEFPRALYPQSNEAEMITVYTDQVQVGSLDYYSLLSRQFQRLIQWYQDRNEERWVKEGLAALASRLNGLHPDHLERSYLERPDTSLTGWQEEMSAVHQGAAYLFATYFHDRFGDAGTRALTAQQANGTAGFDGALAELGHDLTFEDLLAGWLATNFLDSEPGAGSPDYTYPSLELTRPATAAVYEDYPVTVEASVQQFGADYILLRGNDDLHIRFDGVETTVLLDAHPHSGQYLWWSNRADESLTTLSRAFDLSSVQQVTMTYWTWYDIEPGYDYAIIEVSTDGGQQWHVLPASSTTGDNPYGNSPGWGYTGRSGQPAGWIQERVDLSSYTGGEVLVRFVYLTDEAVTGMGFLLDDISIPAIGYTDDTETGDGGWVPAGFIRSDNTVVQRYLALLIGITSENAVTVERLPVKEDEPTEWAIPLSSAGWREAVLVLSGLAPLTSHPAPYQLAIEK